MKFLNTYGIVINKRAVGEADTALTLFTSTYGRMNLYIKGIRKSKKRERNAVDLLSLSKFTFYKRNESIVVNNFELLDPYLDIRMDMEKVNIAMYMLSILNKILVENQRNTPLYEEVRKTLSFLGKIDEKNKKYLLICYFLNRIIDEEGISLRKGSGNYLNLESSTLEEVRGSNTFFLEKEELEIILKLNSKDKKDKIGQVGLNSIIKVITLFEKYINYHLHTNLDYKYFLGEDIRDATVS